MIACMVAGSKTSPGLAPRLLLPPRCRRFLIHGDHARRRRGRDRRRLQLCDPGVGRQQRQPHRLGPGSGRHHRLRIAQEPMNHGIDQGGNPRRLYGRWKYSAVSIRPASRAQPYKRRTSRLYSMQATHDHCKRLLCYVIFYVRRTAPHFASSSTSPARKMILPIRT